MAAPSDNFSEGFYHLIDRGQQNVEDFRYRLRDSGSTVETETFTAAFGISASGSTVTFPSREIQSVSGDFNELEIGIRTSDMVSGLYYTVGVWTFSTENSGGNNVQVNSPTISFSGNDGVIQYILEDGLQTSGNTHIYSILSGSTERDTESIGASGFSVNAREVVRRTNSSTLTNTGSNTHTIDTARIRIDRGNGPVTVSSGSIGPFEWGPQAEITINSADIYFTDNDK